MVTFELRMGSRPAKTWPFGIEGWYLLYQQCRIELNVFETITILIFSIWPSTFNSLGGTRNQFVSIFNKKRRDIDRGLNFYCNTWLIIFIALRLLLSLMDWVVGARQLVVVSSRNVILGSEDKNNDGGLTDWRNTNDILIALTLRQLSDGSRPEVILVSRQ